MRLKKKQGESGNSLVEVALMTPWIFLLFVGLFDFGFYAYATICTENAARAAAIQTAANATAQNDTTACNAALKELSFMPNVAGVSLDCTQLPVIVTRKTLCGSAVNTATVTTCISSPPTNPLCADCSLDNKAASSQVAVQYQTIPLIPIPGLLQSSKTNLTRIVEMRIIAR